MVVFVVLFVVFIIKNYKKVSYMNQCLRSKRLDYSLSVLKGNNHFKKNANNNSRSNCQQRSLNASSNLLSFTALSSTKNQTRLNAVSSILNLDIFIRINLSWKLW